ncbi:MAG: hypothetical protein C5B59_10560, partial [Bacteroidetes bacterium]
MKNCIYIPGLGEAFNDQSVLQYAERLKNAMNINDPQAGNIYKIKQEKMTYGDQGKYTSSAVTITQTKAGISEDICRVYELDYRPTLLDEYKNGNIFYKSLLLAGVIVRKFPLVVLRLFVKSNTGYFQVKMRVQAFYSFMILAALGVAGFLLLPAAISFILEKLQVVHIKMISTNHTILAAVAIMKTVFHYILAISALV